MRKTHSLMLVSSLAMTVFLAGCTTDALEVLNPKSVAAEQALVMKGADSVPVVGGYAGEGYEKRLQGYDFVTVDVRPTATGLEASFRSKAKRNPTCTVDVPLKRVSPDHYAADFDGKTVDFLFTKKGLSVTGPLDAVHETAFYCSGGANLAGDYARLDAPLDRRRLDNTQYAGMLVDLDGVALTVKSVPVRGGGYEVSVNPLGADGLVVKSAAPVVSAAVEKGVLVIKTEKDVIRAALKGDKVVRLK